MHIEAVEGLRVLRHMFRCFVAGREIPTLAEGIPVMYFCLLLFIYRFLFVFIGSLELEPCTLPTAQHSCCNCGETSDAIQVDLVCFVSPSSDQI